MEDPDIDDLLPTSGAGAGAGVAVAVADGLEQIGLLSNIAYRAREFAGEEDFARGGEGLSLYCF